MPVRLISSIVLLLLWPNTSPAKGYGQFEWGQAVASVRTVRPQLRRAREATDVKLEVGALKKIRAEEARQARLKGAKAYAAWKAESAKRLRRRFASYGHWLKLDGLNTNAQLHFIDGRLYGATVRVLFSRKQIPRADALLGTLTRAYGAPRVFDNPQPVRLLYSISDGSLEVHKLLATKKRNGMLRLDYRATELGGAAAFRREALRERLRWVERSALERARASAEAAQKLKDRRLLRDL